MTSSLEPGSPEWQELEEPLLDLDPHLNIFALANGLDLLKNETGAPSRTVEWFRDGLERRVRIEARPESSPRWVVLIGASTKQDGVRREAMETVARADDFDELAPDLKDLLNELLDRANQIPEEALEPVG